MLSAYSLAEAREMINSKEIDLVILDDSLPDGKGLGLYKDINFFDSPIIMLTSNKDIENKAQAFELGVVDYIEKPFNVKELMIRVQARLKIQDKNKIKMVSRFGPFVVDFSRQDIAYETESQERKYLFLTPIEYRIFCFLTRDSSIKNRELILDHVWGEGQKVELRTVDQHISKLRRKIKPYSVNIRSIHRKGYQIIDNSRFS